MNDLSQSHLEKQQACARVAQAIETGKLADTVREHEGLVIKYYQDVQEQAKESFDSAMLTSKIGFGVLIATVVYVLLFDALHRVGYLLSETPASSLSVSTIGLISGFIIEFVAAVTFWLYSRSAKQFGAFHICLERTHRYLLAYKMVEELGPTKDQTLKDLVCIMASAPMINDRDANSFGASARKADGAA